MLSSGNRECSAPTLESLKLCKVSSEERGEKNTPEVDLDTSKGSWFLVKVPMVEKPC